MFSKETANNPDLTGILDVREVGHVASVRESIVMVEGLPTCMNGQLLEFSDGSRGMVMGFTEKTVQVLTFSAKARVRPGDEVYNRNEAFALPVGEKFIGRLVNALCEPIDGMGPIPTEQMAPVFREGTGVMERQPVNQTMETGTAVIDAINPIAKGQRQLFVGDRMTGKTTVGVDAFLNQKGKGTICIYCCCGKSYPTMLKVVHLLRERGAMSYTIVVAGSATAPIVQQYLAPYTAAMLGEYFMFDGKDVLVLFDDMSKHAWAYRMISLLIGRAPGREAYPGDIFYAHSGLMERAGYLSSDLGGGSMTFLPIVETLQGDMTGYISSNLVSMTDGQLYFNAALFNRGVKPAVDFGLSVSRIGNKAQWPAMKKEASKLRQVYLQYRELLQVTQLKAKISEEAEAKLKRGEALSQLLLQGKNEPIPIEEQVLFLYALGRNILDELSAAEIKRFKAQFPDRVREWEPELLEEIQKTHKFSDQAKVSVDEYLQKYLKELSEGESDAHTSGT